MTLIFADVPEDIIDLLPNRQLKSSQRLIDRPSQGTFALFITRLVGPGGYYYSQAKRIRVKGELSDRICAAFGLDQTRNTFSILETRPLNSCDCTEGQCEFNLGLDAPFSLDVDTKKSNVYLLLSSDEHLYLEISGLTDTVMRDAFYGENPRSFERPIRWGLGECGFGKTGYTNPFYCQIDLGVDINFVRKLLNYRGNVADDLKTLRARENER